MILLNNYHVGCNADKITMSDDKYKNKYKIPSNRLQGYDYGSTGCYFVTICTKNREHYFGEIVNKTNHVETDNYPSLRATEIGEIAKNFGWIFPIIFPL